MTREDAIKVLEMFLHKQCDLERTKFAYDANTVWEAVNMAIKALEQKPVLDKIRAEINSLHNGCGLFNDGVDASLKLIDKYRTKERD